MKTFQITAIEFDFGDDWQEGWECDPIPTQEEIVERVMNCDWGIEDDEDLVDVVTDETGWCIKSIEYSEIK